MIAVVLITVHGFGPLNFIATNLEIEPCDEMSDEEIESATRMLVARAWANFDHITIDEILRVCDAFAPSPVDINPAMPICSTCGAYKFRHRTKQ